MAKQVLSLYLSDLSIQDSTCTWRYNLSSKLDFLLHHGFILYSCVFFMPLSFEHVRHLHSSIEASNSRVDEASDNSVQDKGQNLKSRRKKRHIFH